MGVPCSASQQNNQNKIFNPMDLPYSINVLAYIWSDNGHNLFDYESDSLVKKKIEFNFQARIIQMDRDILALTKNEYVRNQKEIFQFRCNTKHVELCSSKLENGFWKVIRPIQASDLPTIEKQKLLTNTVIKLGRVKLTILDYSFAYEFDDQQGIPNEFEDPDKLNESDCIESNLTCRICLSKLATVDNPFISPCKCIGSVRYIHLKCLQSWINSMMKMKAQNGVKLYYWKSMKCELCKANYKTQFKFKKLQYNLCDIQKPKEPYLILQINHSDKNKEQGLYVIDTKNREYIKVGRTQDCDIKLHDISVSRHHASILVNHQEQSFYIEDNCSKFGTLVEAVPEDLQIYQEQQKKISFQIGRIVVIISVERRKKLKKQQQYRVPSQYEVFRQLRQHEDEEEQMQQQLIEKPSSELDDILINDPKFDYEQDQLKQGNINFLTGSLIQREQGNNQ